MTEKQEKAATVRREKFAGERYEISITSKNIAISDTIKNYIVEKLSKIDRFAKNVLEVLVTIDVQKLTHTVSILIKFLHFSIRVQACTEDMYSAIDKASEKLLKLVRKYKGRLQEYKASHIGDVDLKVNILRPKEYDVAQINDDIEAETLRQEEKQYKFHDVVAKEVMPLKTLTHEEAIMKLELSGEPILIYRGEEDQKLKVIYRRSEDENLGLVEVE